MQALFMSKCSLYYYYNAYVMRCRSIGNTLSIGTHPFLCMMGVCTYGIVPMDLSGARVPIIGRDVYYASGVYLHVEGKYTYMEGTVRCVYLWKEGMGCTYIA